MAVIVIRANAKKLPSTLTKLSSAGEVDPNGPKRRNWRRRNAAETYVHIADSTSHQEWLKKTVHGDDSLADFDAASTAAKHEVWLERQRNKNRSTAHAHWLNGQKSSAKQAKNTASCHQAWLKDMEVPLRLVDGGAYHREMTMEMAAAYVQSLWRGRAARLQSTAGITGTASIVQKLTSFRGDPSRQSSYLQPIKPRLPSAPQAQSQPRSQQCSHAAGTLDARTVPVHTRVRRPFAVEAVVVAEQRPPERRSKVGVPSGCLGRTSKRDKTQESPTSSTTPLAAVSNTSG